MQTEKVFCGVIIEIRVALPNGCAVTLCNEAAG